MQFDTIDSATDAQGVCTVWLNRPEKHNALSAQMIDELTEMAANLRHSSARVVVLAARGKSFCAGGDLQWMQAQMQADRATRQEGARRLAGMLQSWNTLPQPVIGRLHGNAFGGGVGLASICDVAIGVENAWMGLTETKLGLIPATIGPYVIARMGEAAARRVFMSARKFSAQEAQSLGLLAKTVAEDALDRAVTAEVTPYLSCAPGAVAAAKKTQAKVEKPVTLAIKVPGKPARETHKISKNKKGEVIVDHTNRDKGTYDKINLTKKAGSKTIKQGVKATKDWHKTNG